MGRASYTLHDPFSSKGQGSLEFSTSFSESESSFCFLSLARFLISSCFC